MILRRRRTEIERLAIQLKVGMQARREGEIAAKRFQHAADGSPADCG